ncbi:unnamed protein product [Sphagnum balticum]
MDGVFVLRMITIHTSAMFCTDIVDAMWDYFIEETEAEQKRAAMGPRHSIDTKPPDGGEKHFGDMNMKRINEERSDDEDDLAKPTSALNSYEHCSMKSSSPVTLRPSTVATTQAVCLPAIARRRNDGHNNGQQRTTFAARSCTLSQPAELCNATL